ncbi:site-specific integrase [Streptomyces sp. NPDC091215]|uniref:site-specific integrase n=1 Tax=Streptomyces sp. NPDC091215 TaxID=3155192 RepID=UPI003443F6B7
MLVQRVLMPASSLESWTVLGDEGGIVEPVERYLAYLTDIERSPNTVKAYAHDLKDWFVFLGRRGLGWREVRLEGLGDSSPGSGCRLRAVTAGSRCCRRRSITAG